MKIVYISGPYTGADYLDIDRNIAKAREAAAWLAKHGVGFFCPHLHSAHFEAITPTVPASFWYELDIRFLYGCGALVLLDGWASSAGAAKEKAIAEKYEIPIFNFGLGERKVNKERIRLLEWAKA